MIDKKKKKKRQEHKKDLYEQIGIAKTFLVNERTDYWVEISYGLSFIWQTRKRFQI